MPAARAILWKCESWSCSSWAGLPCSSTEPRSSTIIWRSRYKESVVCFTPHLVPRGDGVQPVGDGEHCAAAELGPECLLGSSVGDMQQVCGLCRCYLDTRVGVTVHSGRGLVQH